MLRRDVLRHSARQEYELARHEQDPELVSRSAVFYVWQTFVDTRGKLSLGEGLFVPCGWVLQISRMIVSGRDAVHQVVEKVDADVVQPSLYLPSCLLQALHCTVSL